LAQILDGNHIRDQIKAECRPRVERLVQTKGRPPGLAVILVGENPASQVYVANKTRTGDELGIYNETLTPPAASSTEDLLAIVRTLNSRPDIDGILVQLPLPPHVDTARVLLAVAPEKDVDGFHPCNIGNLATARPGPRPCTPAGIMELLRRYRIPVSGRRAVVVGRSDIVGKPMALLLLHENATVTICHSKTADLPGVCREADILVAAIGRPALVTREFVKPGATVIDVGINRIEDREEAMRIFRGDAARMQRFDKNRRALVGDVNPIDVEAVAGAFTPVPGGVGPLTIAMLMMNTIAACERS
jgi:methylenetetrahydrofolate dehydrogenase (NADP+)/methenyltetrahydrofolate cyclohydrolase